MECKLKKVERLTGVACTIYSIYVEEWEETLFDRFLRENRSSFKNELKDIVSRLQTIGHEEGYREAYFKVEEGSPWDGVCALYDTPSKRLRLYCIQFGKEILIVGGGGEKSEETRALEEDPTLNYYHTLMQSASAELYQKIRERELRFSTGGDYFLGDFEFEINDDDLPS